MNVIELIANGQRVQFSTKSLIINNEEFSYTGISDIKHSSQQHIYAFKYADKWHKLAYDPADEAKFKALFGKIVALNKKRKAQAAAAPAAPVQPVVEPVAPVQPVVEPVAPVAPVAPVPEPVVEPAVEPIAPTVVEDVATPTVVETTAVVETVATNPVDVLAVVAEKESAVENALATTADIAETADDVEVISSTDLPQDVKKSKLKKSLIIFAVVIIAFALAGVAWFLFGPSNNSDAGADGVQQYDDIDQLIDDLQD